MGNENQILFTIDGRKHFKIIAGDKTQLEFEGCDFLYGAWHHVAFVVSDLALASECSLYLNGVKLGRPNVYNKDLVQQRDFDINTKSTQVEFGANFRGRLSRFLVFDKALSSSEVASVYSSSWRAGEINVATKAKQTARKTIAKINKEIDSWKKSIH